ncbi:MAG: type II toxin-antitoxin system VapC family toxin [Acidobacteriota bacterium]
MILVDTSVWIDHLHKSVPALVEALEGEDVVTHPFVIGEIACGDLRDRREVLDLLAALPVAAVATDDEALGLIEDRRLMGKGLSYIDVHLLASTMLTGETQLWTTDKRLQTIAEQLRIAI